MAHISLNMPFSFDASTHGIKCHKSNSGVDEDEGAAGGADDKCEQIFQRERVGLLCCVCLE